ncbi:AAA family ATPase [Salinispira pacifica]|uniref:ATP-dependent Clp protease ATP-binding subunit ClpA n=1 Tax=Salinispira pacifica TaxID=1307761 RepID=V5WGU6_9SPIO|nr:AAA family ATPase [Salinispira pacifica]AHC14789.1 ATP-dependent Clp protease ATP-binding subunit ClpA [Salinispira pacifica]
MKVSGEVQDILNSAYQEALSWQHEFLTPEHVLYAALNFPYPREVISHCGGEPDELREQLKEFLMENTPTVENSEPLSSASFNHVFERAVLHSHHVNKDTIEPGDILVSLFDEPESHGRYFLEQAGVERIGLLEIISHILGRSEQDMNNQGDDDDDDDDDDEIFASGDEEGDENFFAAQEDESEAQSSGKKSSGKKKKAIKAFTRDLVAAAGNGEIDPIIGRDEELERTMQVLMRRIKNNPVLIGKPGVGKTAIVEGLARALSHDETPDLLKNYQLLALDMGALVAGTRYRGDFEERMKLLMKEVESQNNIILFIDELHTVVGTGAASGGSMDASNMLKPALASGKVRIIGATTPEEYRRFIERDHALARRFQSIEVPEPSQDDAYEILKGLRKNYEDHHHVRYSDDALRQAVELSDQYINERYLPDKAIDVIDEIGALIRLRTFRFTAQEALEKARQETEENSAVKPENPSPEERKTESGQSESEQTESEQTESEKAEADQTEAEKTQNAGDETTPVRNDSDSAGEATQSASGDDESGPEERGESGTNEEWDRELWPEVSVEDIETVISKIARVPRKRVYGNEREKLKTLESGILSTLYGQDEAVNTVVESIKRSRAGFRKADKPVANFLFVGPTGVGKTELARQLSEQMGVQLIRFDMTEYQERHSVSRLIGSPPGYVGFEEGGMLTESIRRNPHAVLLLDEVEKAHPDIYNILLQIMDYATLTDNSGRKADFRNVILIMTSNAGARNIGKSLIGFGERVMDRAAIHDAVDKTFSPEFRNRLDKVVVFNGLNQEAVVDIVEKELESFRQQLEEKDVQVKVDKDVVRFLADQGYSEEFGARNISRTVDDLIRARFIDEVLFGKLENGGKARVSLDPQGENAEDKIVIKFTRRRRKKSKTSQAPVSEHV